MLTTAAYLGQYRRELLAEGIREDQADLLVRDAAQRILGDQGVSVEPPCCARRANHRHHDA